VAFHRTDATLTGVPKVEDTIVWRSRTSIIALVSLLAIFSHLTMKYGFHLDVLVSNLPLLVTLVLGGTPLLLGLSKKLLARNFGSDLLGGISIVTSVALGEYLAGTIIVLMLSGGEALETYALKRASSVLSKLAKRMPTIVHIKRSGEVKDVPLDEVNVDDTFVVYPHETCPTDGIVLEGRGMMDESYLTGEPFKMVKIKGASVISGSINGDSVLTIRSTSRAADSRYSKIMEVMRESEANRPKLQRIGDTLGAVYTPIALAVGLLAWWASSDPLRFLSVLVVATPCPLLLAIPIAVIGSISLCARRAIIVKNPTVLEQISQCRTAIFDKTGTLTYGEPTLTEVVVGSGFTKSEVLPLVASLERYSKHPLARAVLDLALHEGVLLPDATNVSEPPGQGLRGEVGGRTIVVTSRNQLILRDIPGREQVPPIAGGLECIVVIDNRYAATLHFRDAPREDSSDFIRHLEPIHKFERLLIISGDRESEVRYLAQHVGISEIYPEKSPEEKLELVRKETRNARTLYVGDGINDAPAMMSATVGMALGHGSDVTAEAAGVVILDNSLTKVDEFIHISRRMRSIALQSAIGGMALSGIGMACAFGGLLTPTSGACLQEIIDLLAVANALRAAVPPRVLHDL